MGILLNLSAAAVLVASLFALTRQLHMLQLNSYYPSRYFGWLKTAFRLRSACSVLFSVLLAFCVLLDWSGWVALILSLLGQGLPARQAVPMAVWLHGEAGEVCARAIGEYGMTPTDVIAALPAVIEEHVS